MPTSNRDILAVHGERLKNLLQDTLEDRGPTKFIVTHGDLKVCTNCLKAEADGVIPFEKPYSNGLLHPTFHKYCRCKEMTSGELAQGIDVKVSDQGVEVGFFEEETASAAMTREFGSGIGPPQPDIRHKLDVIDLDFFQPLFNDLAEKYTKLFLRK